MRKLIYILAALAFTASSAYAKPSLKKKKREPFKVWNLTENTGSKLEASFDTTTTAFANYTPMNAYSIANSYNGTWGSPLQSKIWLDRTEDTDFPFTTPYDAYFISPSELPYFDTKTPFASLNYQTFGFNQTKEDNFNALFSVNANKKFNISALVDYMRAMGMYTNQATKQIKAGLWGYYHGKRYEANAAYMYQQFFNEENGGVTSTDYVTNSSMHPDNPVQIPVNLNNEAQSRLKSHYVFFNQKVHLALRKVQLDSVRVEYKPIFSAFHTFNFQQFDKRYREDSASVFYNTPAVNPVTKDSARQYSVRNHVGVSLDEGFSKYVPFSLIAYAGHEWMQYKYLEDSATVKDHENNIFVGAELSKRTGKNLFFDINGEVFVVGPSAGTVNVDGKVKTVFPLKKDTIGFSADVAFSNKKPSYWDDKYASNYTGLCRDNHFDMMQKLHVGAKASWQNKYVELGVSAGFDNLSNYVYYGNDANPTQYAPSIQIINGRADVNLNAWIFHLDNSLVYQQSSNTSIIDLPTFSAYSNLYVFFPLFRVLKTQIGVDCYYNTAYYAPKYMPVTGVFYTQQDT
ncbi:MAG: putative porin, partial [Paludibacteraceae bacterium]|nr:putative porin [Paludibacteraceae bacterium]